MRGKKFHSDKKYNCLLISGILSGNKKGHPFWTTRRVSDEKIFYFSYFSASAFTTSDADFPPLLTVFPVITIASAPMVLA